MQFQKIFVFLLFCLVYINAGAQTREITFSRNAGDVFAHFFLLEGEQAEIQVLDQNDRVLIKETLRVAESKNWHVRTHNDNGAHIHLLAKTSPVAIPFTKGFAQMKGRRVRLFIYEGQRLISEGPGVVVSEGIVEMEDEDNTEPLPAFFAAFMQEHGNAIRDLLAEDVVPISEACSTDYSDRFTRPYECMRSFIPGVQQLHKVLAYLRDNDASWVLPENSTSPYVRIIDRFGNGVTHGDYVSLAFETISANKRNICNISLEEVFNPVSYCYSTSSVTQVNVSLGYLDFAARGSVIPDLSREGILTHEIRVGTVTGNTPFNRDSRNPITPPVLGPEQNSLGAVMDTGYITIVGGWSNGLLTNLLINPNNVVEILGLDGITEEEAILLTNRLHLGARSCEIEGGDPATAEWCILFPHYFYSFNQDGSHTIQQGTSGAVALYNGVFDLLSTIFHPVMSSTETDAVIRSCAVDSTQAGREVLDNFPDYVSFIGDEYENTPLFYGTDGVDSVTGVGKGDLSCLIAEDGSLVLDPRTLIDSSLP